MGIVMTGMMMMEAMMVGVVVWLFDASPPVSFGELPRARAGSAAAWRRALLSEGAREPRRRAWTSRRLAAAALDSRGRR